MANVIAGDHPSNDPEYVTPVGSMTNSKIVDNAIDLGFGILTPTNTGFNLMDKVNKTSTVVSAGQTLGSIKDNVESTQKKSSTLNNESRTVISDKQSKRSYYDDF